jgi:alkyl sulfatase BDS1-like metallo-beta-lactamase superfamily hydrolase
VSSPGRTITVNLDITDTGDQAVLFLANGALSHSSGRQDQDADTTLTMTRSALDDIILGAASLQASVDRGAVTLTGNAAAMADLVSFLDTFELWFNIVTP